MSDYPPPEFDTSRPYSARVWNYLQGGKDHFPADRAYGDKIFTIYPEIVEKARAARAFLGRAVTYLAGVAGIRQFLDIGTGLPAAGNTHEVAQRVAPTARVVYVDNDPLVLVHARALLTSTPEGATAYVDADVRDPEKILAAAADTLDFAQPVALLLLGIMGHIVDDDEAYAIVRQLVSALSSGSYVVFTDGTRTLMGEEVYASIRAIVDSPEGFGYQFRTPDEIARFFDGLDLLEPGVVSTPRWRPAPGPAGPPAAIDEFCGVARKP